MTRTLPSRVRVTTLHPPIAPGVLEPLRRIARTCGRNLNDPNVPERVTAVALAGGTPIGFAQVSPTSADARKDRLEEVVVIPQWRHRGIGRALVYALAGPLQHAGHDAIEVDPDSLPQEVTAFIREIGFTVSEEGRWRLSRAE